VGAATILESGSLYDDVLAFYRRRGSQHAIREIVIIEVRSAQPVDSPLYDAGLSEAEVRVRMEQYFQSLRAGRAASQGGE
jgi:hypothetical protein